MTNNPNFPPPNATIPTFDRMLTVAAGFESWSDEELNYKRSRPMWLLHEAHAYLVLAMLAKVPKDIRARLRQAADQVVQLPNDAAIEYARAYLRTFLPETLNVQFDDLFTDTLLRTSKNREDGRGFSISRRQWLVGGGVAAATFMAGSAAWWWFGRNHSGTMVAAPPSSFKLPTLTEPVDQTGRNPHAAAGADALFMNDALPYRAKHPHPLAFQWLVHIDGDRASLLGFNDNQGALSFTRPLPKWLPEQLKEPDWRYEFFIIVTANKANAFFPSNSAGLPKPLSVLDSDQLALLEETDDLESQMDILAAELTRPFGGPNEASIHFTRYRNQNELRSE